MLEEREELRQEELMQAEVVNRERINPTVQNVEKSEEIKYIM